MKVTENIKRLCLNFSSKNLGEWYSWSKLSKERKKRIPYCEVCGDKTPKKMQVHHIIPQHVCKENGTLELILDDNNLINACYSCHLQVCHKGNFKKYRVLIRSIADYIKKQDTTEAVIKDE